MPHVMISFARRQRVSHDRWTSEMGSCLHLTLFAFPRCVVRRGGNADVFVLGVEM
jgi:hypothetical protein